MNPCLGFLLCPSFRVANQRLQTEKEYTPASNPRVSSSNPSLIISQIAGHLKVIQMREVGNSYPVIEADQLGLTVLWWPMAGGQHVFMRKSLFHEA